MKSKLLYVAAFLVMLSMSFTFEGVGSDSSVEWMWKDMMPVPVILIVSALVCAVVSVFQKKKSGTGHLSKW